MKTVRRIGQGTGIVILALLGCVLMPVLIWVGLGTALYQRNQAGKLLTKTEPTQVPTFATGILKDR